jgi:Yip1 domain
MSAVAPTPELEPVMSQPARIINTFIAPSKAFTGLDRNASWWMAWLLLSIVGLGFIYTVDKKIGMEEITRVEIAKNTRAAEQMEKMPPEQRDRVIATQAKVGKYMGYAAPFLNLIFFCVVGAVLMATFNFGVGTKVPFKTALAIVVFGSLPGLISALLGILSLVAGLNPEGFNIRNPVASNPAYFMDPTQHKFLYGVMSAVDIFSLWMVVLIGIGFAINGKVKKSTAIGIVLGWFLVVKIVGSGFSALF